MTPERLQQIDALFHSALERDPAKRSAFIIESCNGDEELRHEIESLLASHEQAGDFIEAPVHEVAARLIADNQKRSMVGRVIGHYKIIELLGEGGMGEVYLAQDPRLDRKIALKLLPAYFTRDVGRLRRFEQEARSASSLNHPNILTIYEIGKVDDLHFIATEFIDGVTLRQHMTASPSRAARDGNPVMTTRIKLGEVLDITAQAASALAAAHAAGIIHRDVKPENIMVRRDGYVKVLDFGLAKLTEREANAAHPEAPTVLVNTDPGLVMGTVRYMSPEQARGSVVDARADIWSLGIVLYEMLAGRVPFEGETASHVIVSILEQEPPPLARYAAELPTELERIVNKALRKNREERYQTIKDLSLDLKSLKQELEVDARLERSGEPHPSGRISGKRSGQTTVETTDVPTASTVDVGLAHPTSSTVYLRERLNRFGWPSVILVILLVSIVAVWFTAFRPSRAPAPASKVTPFTSYTGRENNASFSPDGNQIAFVWDGEKGDNYDIYVKLIDAGTPLRLTTNPAADSYPAFSPDGRYIAFVRPSESGAGIYLIAALGGTERKLADQHLSKHFLGTRLSWSPDGKF